MSKRRAASVQHLPVQVDKDTPNDRLDPMSRRDLSGRTRVEHKIKVSSLGNVSRPSLDAFRKQYATVQNSQRGDGLLTKVR